MKTPGMKTPGMKRPGMKRPGMKRPGMKRLHEADSEIGGGVALRREGGRW